MKLAEIAWLEITDCYGAEKTVQVRSCDCDSPCLDEHGRERRCVEIYSIEDGGGLMNIRDVVEYARDVRRERTPWEIREGLRECVGDWPWIVEQLVAEGVLK